MSRAVFRSSWERRLGKTESPIEARFLEVFCAAAVEQGYDIARQSKEKEGVIIVTPQKEVDRYRVDFLITYPFFGAVIEIVAECDGHAFHEVTRQQASRDKRRDRDLQRLGYKVFRFTGSDIHGDARGCAADVLAAIMEFQTAEFMRAIETAQQRAA